MKKYLQDFYRFLPVQLLLLHFRKYQLLLIFWVALFATILNKFAVHFGGVSLFLSPEYLGATNMLSFFLLGGATAIFSMSWHITTFIVHSKRMPFLGATRHAFLKYCINNAALPLVYLITYGILTVRYLSENEAASILDILFILVGFYLGYILILILSFTYFFRVNRNLLKSVLSTVANPSIIRNLIPYDTLDREFDLVDADSYLDKLFRVKKIKTNYQYNQRLIAVILRRHHRNAMFAIFVALAVLLFLGVFMNEPLLRIPAGASFLLLFTVMLAAVGAFKYFLRSWEIIGWIAVFGIVSLLTYYRVFDLRSLAYGMEYKAQPLPEYNYEAARKLFTDTLYQKDKEQERDRLNRWLAGRDRKKPPLIIISVSGGGSRSAFWTFRCLQVADSMTQGKLFQNTVMISGASGGMMGAAYWRAIHTKHVLGKIKNPYDPRYQQNIGKDLLNAVVFSLASVDFISPFNKITVAGRRYTKDRGYAFDHELVANTGGVLNTQLKDFRIPEAKGIEPMLVISSTIINDGRKLLIAAQPVSYLTRSESSLHQKNPVIDGIDFTEFFKNQDPYDLKLASALRMGATFPIILPIVKLPSLPEMNVMDAGLRDNFGVENSSRYLHVFRDWLKENAGNIIYLEIRDTKQTEPSAVDEETSMASMLLDPIFAIQQQWSAFQTFSQTYVQDYIKEDFLKSQYHKIVLEYSPQQKGKSVALNLHLTGKDKEDLLQSIYNAGNQEAFIELQKLVTDKARLQKQNQENGLNQQ
jgi:hypothetical protein